MMFNQYFPNKPPYVRVVNHERKSVNPYYDLYQSPNDKQSYVLNNKLNNLVSWAPGSSCVNYIVTSDERVLVSEVPALNLPFLRIRPETNSRNKEQRKEEIDFRQKEIAITQKLIRC